MTDRWRLGLSLALITSVLWGVMPIALKIVLEGMDVYTISWYRFALSALVVGVMLAATGQLPQWKSVPRRGWILMVVALLGLAGNYLLYAFALKHTTPSVTQTVIQLAPMLLLLGGVLVVRERFSPLQWCGFGALFIGLLLFFNRRLPELLDLSGGLGLGVALLVMSSVVWARTKTAAEVAEFPASVVDALCRRDDHASAHSQPRHHPRPVAGSALHASVLCAQHDRRLRSVC